MPPPTSTACSPSASSSAPLASTQIATLLGLPTELRLVIYAHLIAPALAHRELNWEERSRGWYKMVYTSVLPETKLILVTLRALSASCSILREETKSPLEEVGALLVKQKHYCGWGIWGDSNWLF